MINVLFYLMLAIAAAVLFPVFAKAQYYPDQNAQSWDNFNQQQQQQRIEQQNQQMLNQQQLQRSQELSNQYNYRPSDGYGRTW